MAIYKNRSEVPEKYKWDLSDFFKSETEFKESFDKTTKLIDELKNYVGCTKEPSRLYEYLNKYINAVALWMDLYGYAHLINDQELGVSDSIERKNKTELLNKELSINSSFFSPELLKLSNDEYVDLFKKEPRLLEYKSDLDKTYRAKKYVLDEAEEKIISELINSANSFSDFSSDLMNNEIDYGKIKLDDGNLVSIATTNYNYLMKNKNQAIRKKIYNSFNKKIDQYVGSFAGFLNGYVSLNISNAKLHHYDSAWDHKLFSLNLPNTVFSNLVEVIEENVKSFQKYFKLKKKVLGLKVFHPYDNSLEISNYDKKYTIEEAQELIRNALKPLGKDYLDKYEKIILNKYIDYCQYKGKCSGGYSLSTLLKDSRILMSYNNDLISVSTIIHEAGHNIHHQFVNENNPLQYRDVDSFIAEVVSLTNECLLSDYLVKNGKTKEEKLAGLNNLLGVIVSNLFGAVREGKIEQDMYEYVLNGGTLTKDYLGSLSFNSLKKYYGNVLKLNDYSKNDWVKRSHYFMNFYLYSYAICMSVACNIASKILDGDKDVLERYYEFMKCGSDKWHKDVFKVLGIDLEDKELYKNAIKYFDSLIDKYYEIWNGKEN